MYLTVKQQIKHLSVDDYLNLRELCHIAKNLYNEAMYNIRQYYFQEGEYLNYQKNYALLKHSENYKILNSNMAQQILKEVDGSFKSFFGLLKLAKKGKYNFRDIRLPSYLSKDGFTTLVIGFVRLKNNTLIVPFSQSYKKEHKSIVIKLPPILADRKIKEIRIIPKQNAKFFEIQYTYERECIQRKLNINQALALDIGVNNLVTAVSTKGKSFIIDGRKLKSINQFYNKQISYLQSITDKQKGPKRTKKINNITTNRNNYVNDYMNKVAKTIINYCIENQLGTLVIGYNETFQRSPNMKKKNNQNFVMIPFGKLRDKLKYLCKLNGIKFVKQEESYTSKASFWDKDEIPVYNEDNPQKYKFSGVRQKRGLYKTSTGKKLNADVNAALNILSKSKVVPLTRLYHRGEVDAPKRIRVA